MITVFKLLFRLILSELAWQRFIQAYEIDRSNGGSRFAILFNYCLTVCAWSIFKLESPVWQKVLENHLSWFPHIHPQRKRSGDCFRYLIQALWLLFVRPYTGRFSQNWHQFINAIVYGIRACYFYVINCVKRLFLGQTSQTQLAQLAHYHLDKIGSLGRKILFILLGIFAAVLALACISQPFTLESQFVFVLVLWAIAMVVRQISGRLPVIILIILSLIISCRYIWWRYTATLNWDDTVSFICGFFLLIAETYAWIVLILGYFQAIWPLNRNPVPLPLDPNLWPSVDIMIPTYNESLSVVKPTVYAALGIDWPKEKLNIYILDDGTRDIFKEFSAEVGVHYVTRKTHEHAKAGNINHALQRATGEYVSIFDCDHVPTRSFLQLTMGWFLKDKKLGMLQTPHHFFSPDPFERNLGRFRQTPNEGTLFYGLLQDGNDMWDATFFCGSCAILRRSALDEVGGIATQTVTEDAHTSLRLHRKGHTSAYIRIPLAAGLATESLSAHIGQRIRWARGMIQILRLDNPLFGKGLKWQQRLCYVNAMLHFLSGIPRIIFLIAPLAFLLLHAYIIFAPALAIVLYVLPHMVHASLTNSQIQGKYRHSFWSEIYESVLAWYIARPTTVALFNPHKGTFNVTAKGGLVEERHIDWEISTPYLVLVMINILGLIMAVWRFLYGPVDEILTVIVSSLWVLYNMTILGGAVAVSVESKQIRHAHRVEMLMTGALSAENGHLYPCVLHDYSDGGVGLSLKGEHYLKAGDKVDLMLKRDQKECVFPAIITRAIDHSIGIKLDTLNLEEQINFIQCTFARADTWSKWQKDLPQDKPMQSLYEVLALGFRGYQRMAEYAPPSLKMVLIAFTKTSVWMLSFCPRTPTASKMRNI